MSVSVFDERQCALGEGPLWHPLREQLFWFDILGKRMLSNGGQVWQFDEHVSAAGWVDHDTLLIASETELFNFGVDTGVCTHVVPLDAENAVTRSNDGRADPFGGFWIGTLGRQAQAKAGAIYRYYRGEVRELFGEITISNAICFSPDGQTAYFTDTPTRQIMRVGLDNAGWPVGEPEVFVDLREEGLNPDGAIVDGEGCLWNAQWGAGRVARYAPDGQFMEAVDIPAAQATCPAFGGGRMFVTSALHGLNGAQDGMTFAIETDVVGQREHQVIL